MCLDVAEAVWRAVNEHGHPGLELEFRLGRRLPGGAFVSSIGPDAFKAIKTKLDASNVWDAVYDVDTVDLIHSAAKHVTTIRHLKNGDPLPVPPPRWLTKTRVANIDYEFDTATPFSARASVSIESFAPAGTECPPTTARRTKCRRRYVWKCWAFDLTQVHSTLPGDLDNDDATYELEIELLDPGMVFERTMDSLAEWGKSLLNDAVNML